MDQDINQMIADNIQAAELIIERKRQAGYKTGIKRGEEKANIFELSYRGTGDYGEVVVELEGT